MEMDIDDIDVDEDEWYYSSIIRYKKLSMFEMQNAVHQVEVTDFKTICTVNKWSEDQYEISELSLPNKLMGASDDEGRVNKENDLKLKCGRFTNNPISQIKIIQNERRLVSSEMKVSGITVYELSNDDSDEIKNGAVIECGLVNPWFALNNNRLAALATDTCCTPLLIDLNSGQVKNKFPPAQECQKPETVHPMFVTSNMISLCNTGTGMVALHDTRMSSPGECINPSLSDRGNVWSHTTLYESTIPKDGGNAADSTILALISDCGSLIMYDTRHLGNALLHSKLQMDNRLIYTDVHSLRVRFKPSDVHMISVSGLNSNVHIFDVSKNQPKELFVHDGHRFTESGYREAITSSHVWFSHTELDNFLISSSYNKTIQFWQFNIV